MGVPRSDIALGQILAAVHLDSHVSFVLLVLFKICQRTYQTTVLSCPLMVPSS